MPLRDARAGLKALAGEVRELGGAAVELAARRSPAPPPPPPKLLGAFEPVLLGWVSRDDLVGPHRDRVTAGGVFRSFALVGGRVVATWRLAGGEVTLEPLEEIAPEDAAALDADAADVRRFLGL